jgi:hypothetical protein
MTESSGDEHWTKDESTHLAFAAGCSIFGTLDVSTITFGDKRKPSTRYLEDRSRCFVRYHAVMEEHKERWWTNPETDSEHVISKADHEVSDCHPPPSTLHKYSSIMTSQKLSADDLKSILEFTTSLARKAGALILEGSESIQAAGAEGESNVGEKKNSVDLVTEYDVRVEQLVQSELRSKYPTFKL